MLHGSRLLVLTSCCRPEQKAGVWSCSAHLSLGHEVLEPPGRARAGGGCVRVAHAARVPQSNPRHLLLRLFRGCVAVYRLYVCPSGQVSLCTLRRVGDDKQQGIGTIGLICGKASEWNAQWWADRLRAQLVVELVLVHRVDGGTLPRPSDDVNPCGRNVRAPLGRHLGGREALGLPLGRQTERAATL